MTNHGTSKPVSVNSISLLDCEMQTNRVYLVEQREMYSMLRDISEQLERLQSYVSTRKIATSNAIEIATKVLAEISESTDPT